MNQTLLFVIGAVIFLAVATAMFLYGQMTFRDWQDRDAASADGRRRAGRDERLAPPSAPSRVVEPITQARPPAAVTGDRSREPAA